MRGAENLYFGTSVWRRKLVGEKLSAEHSVLSR